MCLIVFSHNAHERYRLVLAANRDERHDRSTRPMEYWDDAEILAGRDLEAGGTWFGIAPSGRWSAITNFHDRDTYVESAPSRGMLVRSYLESTAPPEQFLSELQADGRIFNGFSILVGDGQNVGFYSNREQHIHMLSPGVYGLSNHLLDTDWPKVVRARRMLTEKLQEGEIPLDPLLHELHDATVPSADELPPNISKNVESVLAPMFIRSDRYGTRSTTALTISSEGRVEIAERSYDSAGDETETRRYTFETSPVEGP